MFIFKLFTVNKSRIYKSVRFDNNMYRCIKSLAVLCGVLQRNVNIVFLRRRVVPAMSVRFWRGELVGGDLSGNQ